MTEIKLGIGAFIAQNFNGIESSACAGYQILNPYQIEAFKYNLTYRTGT